MKKKSLILVVFLGIITMSGVAQEVGSRFSFELAIGPSFTISKMAGSSLNTGAGIEGTVHYRFMPHTGIYAGWGWNKHSSDHSFAGNNADFEETGYLVGFQFKHPIGIETLSYYLRAAGLYNHIEIENAEGNIIHDTGHGLGWQLAAGMQVPIGGKWSLTPGVKFSALSRKLNSGSVIEKLNLNDLTLRIGIAKGF